MRRRIGVGKTRRDGSWGCATFSGVSTNARSLSVDRGAEPTDDFFSISISNSVCTLISRAIRDGGDLAMMQAR